MEGIRTEKQVVEDVDALPEKEVGVFPVSAEKMVPPPRSVELQKDMAKPQEPETASAEGVKGLEHERKRQELGEAYDKIKSLEEDKVFLQEELDRIGEPGIVIKLPWWAHWRLRERALKELVWKKKQIVLTQEKREEFGAALEKTEFDLRAAEVLRDRLEGEVYPSETAGRLKREREEAAKLKEATELELKASALAVTSGEIKEETGHPNKFISLNGGDVETTGVKEFGGYHIGDVLKLKSSLPNKINKKVVMARNIMIVGFTKEKKVVIRLDGDRVVFDPVEDTNKYYNRLVTVEGLQTAKDWIESQIPEATAVEKPPEKIEWIDGEEFQESQLLTNVEMLGGYQIGDRLRIKKGATTNLPPAVKSAKEIKVFGFTRKGGKEDEVILIFDNRFLAKNTLKLISQRFEFIGR